MGGVDTLEDNAGGLGAKLKKVPKWVWLAGGGILILVLFMRGRSGGTVPTQLGATPGGIGQADGGTDSAYVGGGLSGSDIVKYMNETLANFQTNTIDYINRSNNDIRDDMTLLLREQNESTTNLLTDMSKQLANESRTVSGYEAKQVSLLIPYIDSEYTTVEKAFSTGIGGGDYNTATSQQRNQMKLSGQLLKSGNQEALAAELARTESVIANRKKSGEDISDQLAWKARVQQSLASAS